MKDIVKVGFFVAIEEPSGKVAKALAETINKVATHYSSKIDKLIDHVIDKVIEKEQKTKI